jgi:surface polysaccharide O-acyltransferase-like enzyme
MGKGTWNGTYMVYRTIVVVLCLLFLWIWNSTKDKECIERTLDGLVIERMCTSK